MKNIINKQVTDKQKNFARYIVENSFGENAMSHSACAKKAGYAPESAGQRAYELTNPEFSPKLCSTISLANSFCLSVTGLLIIFFIFSFITK